MKAFYNLTIKKVFREKKRTIIHSLIICFAFLIIYSAFTFLYIFNNYMEESVYKNINFRVMAVNYLDNISRDKELEALRKIEHVSLVVLSNEFETLVKGIELSNNNRDGSFFLIASKKEMLPEIIKGRELENDETGVLICSSDFLPDSTADYKLHFKNSDYIKGKELLNTNLKVTYSEYDSTNKLLIQTYNEEFKVVGIYNAKNNFMGNNYCFANYQDVLRINEIIYRNMVSDSYFLPYIVVDKAENVAEVQKSLTDMGYYYTLNYSFEPESIKVVNILIISLVIFSSIIFLITMLLYVRKNMKNKFKQIGLLKSLGYNNKLLFKSLLVEQFSILLLGFILSIILYTIGFAILILLSNYVYLNMKVFHFEYPILIMIASFILYLFIMYFTYIMSEKKISKMNPIDSMKE